jgi:hypothetical protein
MAKKQAIVQIEAVIEYDDTLFDIDDIDDSVVICFRKEDKYIDEELFLPKMDGMEVIEYINVGTGELEE